MRTPAVKDVCDRQGDLRHAILQGAVKRIRPKFMTVAVMFMGLVPIMWSAGAGADVMKRIAAPMIGGIFTSFVLELVVYPAIYEIWKWHFGLKQELALAESAPRVASLSVVAHAWRLTFTRAETPAISNESDTGRCR